MIAVPAIRNEMVRHNKSLAEAAKMAGVKFEINTELLSYNGYRATGESTASS